MRLPLTAERGRAFSVWFIVHGSRCGFAGWRLLNGLHARVLRWNFEGYRE